MNRRECITLIGGVAAWPCTARAQPSDMRRVGVLMNSNPADAIQHSYWATLIAALKDVGWAEGQNVRIDTKWSDGDAKLMASQAQELVGLRPDVLIPVGTGNLQAVRRAGQTIPIVFLQVSDPVAQGIVKNLARPGANITGFSAFESEMGGKWLAQLKQIAPAGTRAVVVFNLSTSPQSNVFVRSMESAAQSLGIQVTAAHVRNDEEIEAAINGAARQPGTGIVIPTDSFTQTRAERLVALINHYRVPAIYAVLLYARAGGLICYTVDFPEQFKQAAIYVDRILKGAKAGDLPVQTPTKFSLVINRSTAKLLGLEVPERLLFTADEVIE